MESSSRVAEARPVGSAPKESSGRAADPVSPGPVIPALDGVRLMRAADLPSPAADAPAGPDGIRRGTGRVLPWSDQPLEPDGRGSRRRSSRAARATPPDHGDPQAGPADDSGGPPGRTRRPFGGGSRSTFGDGARSTSGGDAGSAYEGGARSASGGDAGSAYEGDARSTFGGDARSIYEGDAGSAYGGDARSTFGGDARSTYGGDARSGSGGVRSGFGGDARSGAGEGTRSGFGTRSSFGDRRGGLSHGGGLGSKKKASGAEAEPRTTSSGPWQTFGSRAADSDHTDAQDPTEAPDSHEGSRARSGREARNRRGGQEVRPDQADSWRDESLATEAPWAHDGAASPEAGPQHVEPPVRVARGGRDRSQFPAAKSGAESAPVPDWHPAAHGHEESPDFDPATAPVLPRATYSTGDRGTHEASDCGTHEASDCGTHEASARGTHEASARGTHEASARGIRETGNRRTREAGDRSAHGAGDRDGATRETPAWEPRAWERRPTESRAKEPRAKEPRARDPKPRKPKEPRPRRTPEERAQAALERAEAARAEIAKNPEQAARAICLRLLNDRPRTRSELAAALAKRGVPEEAAAAVLDRYDEVGLIDDAAFARAWVSTRHQGRGLARRALGQELRRKGVDSDTIGEALEELDPETEEATARAFVARRMRSVSGPPEAVLRKVVGALARKGYPPGLAFRVVKEAMEQAGQDADFDPDALEDSHLGDL